MADADTFVFALLCVQQLVSHALFAWELWGRTHRLDTASVLVFFFFMPAALVLLLREDRLW